MESEEDSTVVATYVFRGIEYIVTMNVLNNRSTLVVEVEDRLTADQWRGSFDAACKINSINFNVNRVHFKTFILRKYIILETLDSFIFPQIITNPILFSFN